MASTYSRSNYSPYSKGSSKPSQQLPLRSKAFSHLDNINQTTSTTQNTPSLSNQDKIAEIKKKYEKILTKSSNKSNQQNQAIGASSDYNRNVSAFQNFNENSRYKGYQTPTTNKDRKAVDLLEPSQIKNNASKPYALRQYINPPKNDTKSNLESNRMTLNAMKSELQTKLKDLSNKTSSISAVKNPPIQPQRKQQNNCSYEAILNKYSKAIVQNRTKVNKQPPSKYTESIYQQNANGYKYQKRETLESKIKQTVISNYIPNYSNSNKSDAVNVDRPSHAKQLSTISQISNSNHSQVPKEVLESDRQSKNKASQRIKKIQDKYKNTQSNLVIESTNNDNKNWFKNTTSYLNEPVNRQKVNQEVKTQFTLQKLENTQGFSVKRTVTEEHFMNMNKINMIQNRFDQRQKARTTYANRTTEPIQEQASRQKLKIEPTKLDFSVNESNFTPKNKGQASKQVTHSQVNEPMPQTISKYYQKSVHEEKTQIQKLKQKYNIGSTTKYSNPYREKKVQKESNNQKNEKSENRNNQLISKEIQKLDNKIKQIQQNKKQLNINFKPYQVSKSVPKPTLNQQSKFTVSHYEKAAETPVKESDYNPPALNNYINLNTNVATPNKSQSNSTITTTNDRSKYNMRYQAYLQRVKPMYSQITLPENKQQASPFAIKLLPVENTGNNQEQVQQPVSKSRVNEYINKVELQNRTDTGIQQRKKKLQEKVELNNNIKNLVKVFGQQAVYDEGLRNNKIWFASENNDRKWIQIKTELNSIGINLTQSQLKEILTLDESQNNPFFSISDNKCNYKSLAQNYKQSQRHWQQKILHQFNKNELYKQNFNNNKLDFDKKGYIEIQDLVRFLNIQSGTFLRNRDVSIIYKRMCGGADRLQFDQLINIISM